MGERGHHDRFESTGSDRYGFVAHMRWRTYVVPTGIMLIVASFGVASFCMLLPAIQSSDAQVLAQGLDKVVKAEAGSLDLTFGSSHIVASIAFVAFVAVGVVILSYARKDRTAYMSAFPHVDLVFTDEERAQSRSVKRYCVGWGIVLWAVAAALFIVFKLLGWGHIATGCLGCVAAPGTWMVVHGGMRAKREDIYAYNFEALKQSSYYALKANVNVVDKKWVLAAKRLSLLAQTFTRVVFTAGALGSFALYALPTLVTPYYWVPLAVAALLALWYTHHSMERSKGLPHEIPDPQTVGVAAPGGATAGGARAEGAPADGDQPVGSSVIGNRAEGASAGDDEPGGTS